MARVITLSRQFLKGHPREGRPTYFVERAFSSLGISDNSYGGVPVNDAVWRTCNPKHHTIRFGRRWKDGDMASLRVWSGKPYASPQIAIAPDVRLRVVDIWVDYDNDRIYIHKGDTLGYLVNGCDKLAILAANDGLSPQDFLDWFQVGKKNGVHTAQILIWGDVKDY
jgi:hypothetical protein